MRLISTVTLLVLAATSTAYAQQAPGNGNGRPPADTHFGADPTNQQANPTAPKVDPAEEAQKRFGSWKGAKQQCLTAAGLTENVHFRTSPVNPHTIQVNDKVWLDSRFNHAAIRQCR